MTNRSQMKLGKKPRRIDPRTLQLAKYTAKLASAPLVFDQTAEANPNFGMMLNDQLGDCAIAAVGHLQQIWTSLTSSEVTATDPAVLAVYEAVGGYVPGDPSTDNGCVMLDVLNYWRKTGIFGNKLGAYAAVNPTSRQEIMDAIYYFGGIYVGLALPETAQTQAEWQYVANSPKNKPDSWGGHCVAAARYSFAAALPGETVPRTVGCITWGSALEMTFQFLATYCDECYALIDSDWLTGAGESPDGFNLVQLQADLSAIGAV
jgi:hypothetical protein